VRTKEPKQLGERRVIVRKQAQNPLVMVSYHVPESRHADNAALQVFDAIMTAGRSSRLYRALVDQGQVAFEVSAELDDAIDPSQWVCNISVKPGSSTETAEKALYAEVKRISDTGVTPAELSKARNQLLASLYRQFKTIAGKANLLGRAEIYYGDWRMVNQFAASLEKVTAADVQRVANLYFTETNRTVAVLVPEEKGGAK